MNGPQHQEAMIRVCCFSFTAAAIAPARLRAIAAWLPRQAVLLACERSRLAIASRLSILFLDQRIAPRHIALGGDSAGGGLSLALMTGLRDSNEPLPGCAWLVSPWVDLAMTGESLVTKAGVDPLIGKPYLEELAAAYLNGADPANPLISPLHADLQGLRPLLVQVGSAETLLDDAVRITSRAGAADVAVTLECIS